MTEGRKRERKKRGMLPIPKSDMLEIIILMRNLTSQISSIFKIHSFLTIGFEDKKL